MAERTQAIIPRDIVARLLAAAGDDLVLIGGQSLSVWMDRYGVLMPDELAFVSRDVDFLAKSVKASAAVRRLAQTLGGHTVFPSTRGAAFTSLVGQAVKELPDETVYNVDVLHKMWGADGSVLDRAIVVDDPPRRFRVLHPLDVLKSRLDNLHGLAEKQTELGKAQLVAAIEVGRAFLRGESANEPKDAKRPAALRYVGFIEKVASGDAGKKVAKRYGIHVADAIEPKAVRSKELWEKRLPRLARLMSAARREELSLTA